AGWRSRRLERPPDRGRCRTSNRRRHVSRFRQKTTTGDGRLSPGGGQAWLCAVIGCVARSPAAVEGLVEALVELAEVVVVAGAYVPGLGSLGGDAELEGLLPLVLVAAELGDALDPGNGCL